LSTWFASKVSQWFCADVKEAAYKKIMEFSVGNIDHFTTPSLITRLTSDINTLQTVIQTFLRLVVRAPILFLGSIFFAVTINKELTVVFVVIFPVLVIALAVIIIKSIPMFRRIQLRLDKLNGILRESLTGARVSGNGEIIKNCISRNSRVLCFCRKQYERNFTYAK
jgi:ATP-binding cassette subfamily B protein